MPPGKPAPIQGVGLPVARRHRPGGAPPACSLLAAYPQADPESAPAF